MREITVNYLLLDENEERLKRITEEYKKQGLNLSKDKIPDKVYQALINWIPDYIDYSECS